MASVPNPRKDEPVKTYALAKHAVFRRTSGDLCMLFDRERGVMYELNETASAVITQIHGGAESEPAIVAGLSAAFSVDEADLSRDVEAFLGDFVSAGLLEVRS